VSLATSQGLMLPPQARQAAMLTSCCAFSVLIVLIEGLSERQRLFSRVIRCRRLTKSPRGESRVTPRG
jgi:hypothetical protein